MNNYEKAIAALWSVLILGVAAMGVLLMQIESAKPDLARLAEYDALLAECMVEIPEGAYCELIARQRRER